MEVSLHQGHQDILTRLVFIEREIGVEQLLESRVEVPLEHYIVHGHRLVTKYGWTDVTSQDNAVSLKIRDVQ